MSEYIPFVTGDDTSQLVKKFYSNAPFVRLSLIRAQQLIPTLPSGMKIWIDPGMDGLHDLDRRKGTPERPSPWFEFMKKFSQFEELGDAKSHEKPDPKQVQALVNQVLEKCAEFRPAWITVPQLPMVNNASRNKINRALAKATGKWKSASKYSGMLMLPVVFTHQNQLNGKTERNPKISLVEKCYHESQSSGVWSVDSSVEDESGSSTLRSKRFPGIISWHEELNAKVQSRIRVAGPYWGINLVLWARGLVDYPAIGVGTGYSYFISGGQSTTPKPRLAVPSLRRRFEVNVEFEKWVKESLASLDNSHPTHKELSDIQKHLPLLRTVPAAREQVAKFYRHWFDAIVAQPKSGRAIMLFQDLTLAYTTGKSLPAVEGAGTARRPESVAESLMLSCL